MPSKFVEARRISLKNIELLEGADVFEGLRQIEVVLEIEGGDPVFTNRRKAQGFTEGNAKISGTLKLLTAEAIEYLKRFPRFFWELHSFTIAAQTDKFRNVLEVVNLRFTKFNFSAEGTDAMESEIPFVALDAKLDGTSIIPEENELAS